MYDKIEKDDSKKIPPIVMFVYKYSDVDKIIKILDHIVDFG